MYKTNKCKWIKYGLKCIIHWHVKVASATIIRMLLYKNSNKYILCNYLNIFYVLLTVHLSIFILVINQLDAQTFVLQ